MQDLVRILVAAAKTGPFASRDSCCRSEESLSVCMAICGGNIVDRVTANRSHGHLNARINHCVCRVTVLSRKLFYCPSIRGKRTLLQHLFVGMSLVPRTERSHYIQCNLLLLKMRKRGV